MIVIAAVVAGILILSGGAAWWKISSDSRAEQVAASEREAEEKERSDAAARAERAADTAERAYRAEIVTALEASIVEDANESVAEGVLEGPILSGYCTATGGGSTDDLTALTGTFECIAVTEQNGDQSKGYAYSATINWSDGSYTWRLGN
ncbi:DUF2510 domain-containing protein [Mycetocola zhujimingii]|uniref:DUF2510 domain-containing protein n=1 Tax=Mycetocola zhujimingii TaxID=2079792 RepID=A0A2U1TB03_9MICO|nr:DUF2510 domain-containing protein [Mycetocola zhujimingii]PWC06069.1 hypothetical protein DF223_13655 [Mycetocola zhujimingii]